MSDESKPPGDDDKAELGLRNELAIRTAEADATIRVVEAIGAQLRTVAESPGVQEVLKGLGQALERRAQQALDAQQQAHELQVQANDLAAQREKRRDYLGAGLLVFIAVLVVCGVWLVATGKVDTKNMLAAVSILAALLTGRLVHQK
jgi:hypothetical protein